MTDYPPRSASAVPGKVVIDDKVREFLERRSQSLRYPNNRPQQPVMSNGTNGTLPERKRDLSEPPRRRGFSERSDSYPSYREEPPPPSLLQMPQESARRAEISRGSISNRENGWAVGGTSVRGRQEPNEFYRSPQNKFKSLPVTTKARKSHRDRRPNFVVATFRWIRSTLFGKKRKKTAVISEPGSDSTMDYNPSRPPYSRSYSLPRNTRFNRRKSSRAETRVPVSRSTEFPSAESNYPTLGRNGSATQLFAVGNGGNHVEEEEPRQIMSPLLRGFPNLGNTCYWNAVLQALGALEPIADFYLNANLRRIPRNGEISYSEEFTLVFAKLIEAMWKNQDGADYIRRMRQIYDAKQSIFSLPYEQDAHEFLMSLVTMLCRDAETNDCFGKECSTVGLDEGVFQRNFGAIISEGLHCCTCRYTAKQRQEFHPFVCLSLPGYGSHLIKYNVIRNLNKQARVYRHALYINSKTDPCMTGTVKLMSHQTGIPDKRLLVFQLNNASFSQCLVTKYDMSRPRQQNEGDMLYVTELEGESLVNGYEVVTILFFHAMDEAGGMQRITEPFKCHMELNATYNTIVNAMIRESGPVIQNSRSLRGDEFDILLHDDNEFEPRILNPMAKAPFMAAHASRCMDDQTRILPYLPRFLRLVIRWKHANIFVVPNNDHIVNHATYNDFLGYEKNSLDAMFAKYFAPEYMGDWKCDRCHSIGGVRTTWYSQPPNILFCTLKRFIHDSTGIIKIDKPASIPLERFDLRRWTGGEFSPDVDDGWHRDDLLYDVASFFCHIGNPMHGHYLAYSRNPVTDVWHIYDDSNVFTVNQNEVDVSNAYVIFMHNTKDRIRRQQQIQKAYRETGFFNTLRSRKSRDREPLNMLPNGPLVTLDQPIPRSNGSFRSDISRRRQGSVNRTNVEESVDTSQSYLRPPSQSGSTFDRRSRNRASRETRI